MRLVTERRRERNLCTKRIALIAFLMSLTGCGMMRGRDVEPPEYYFDEEMHEAIRGEEELDYLIGVYDPKTNPDMALVDRQYAEKDLYLHREAYGAFRRMQYRYQ